MLRFDQINGVNFHFSEDEKSTSRASTSDILSTPSAIEIKESPALIKRSNEFKINFEVSVAIKKMESVYENYNKLKTAYLAAPTKDGLNKCRKELNNLRSAVNKHYSKDPNNSSLVALTKFILQEKIDNKILEYKTKVKKYGTYPESKVLMKHKANLDKLKERVEKAQVFYAEKKEQEPETIKEAIHFLKTENHLMDAAIQRQGKSSLDEVMVLNRLYDHLVFFKKEQQSRTILNIVTNSKKVYPRYHNDDEKAGYNPAFQHIDGLPCCPLEINEKRIWVLRGDLKLATGIKNYYRDNPGATHLFNKIDSRCHRFIDFNDRYGHPTLCTPEYDRRRNCIFDGSAYHAGWMSQREGFIEMLLFSGRFQNGSLSGFQRECVEMYISKLLMLAYGEQPIKFIDFYSYNQIDYFLANQSRAADREYLPDLIKEVTKLENLNVDITPGVLYAARQSVNHIIQLGKG